MAKYLLIIIVILFTSCSINPSPDNKSKKSLKVQFINAKLSGLFNFLANPCDTIAYEFQGIYPILDTLPNANDDYSTIYNYLKEYGFVLNGNGRGNWEKGPRFIMLELKRGDCHCKVYKKYYYNEKSADGTYNLKVTERIVCNSEKIGMD